MFNNQGMAKVPCDIMELGFTAVYKESMKNLVLTISPGLCKKFPHAVALPPKADVAELQHDGLEPRHDYDGQTLSGFSYSSLWSRVS